MTDKPYTDADVELVASTFVTEAKKNPVDTTVPPWMGAQTRYLLGPTEHDIARAVLDALAAAGRMKEVELNDIEATGECCCNGCIGMGRCDLDWGRTDD